MHVRPIQKYMMYFNAKNLHSKRIKGGEIPPPKDNRYSHFNIFISIFFPIFFSFFSFFFFVGKEVDVYEK